MQVCWLCEASKGADEDMQFCFTNTRADAAWRATYLSSNPWSVQPHYANLIGFRLAMIVGDLLHVFNLGTAKDVAGCTLKKLVQDQKIFVGGTIEERLKAATISLKAFAKTRHFNLRMKKLSKSKIKWATKKYPELQSSGSDVHVVCAWLEDLLTQHALEEYQDLTVLLWSGNHAMRILYAAGMFLTSDEQNSVRFLGDVYINTLLRLASGAINSAEYMWKIKPKVHALSHLLDSPRAINPKSYATWLDEDFLKKMSKTLRLTNVKTAQTRVLERWLLYLPGQFQRVKGQLS